MMKRIETGELLYLPRLEKCCRHLQTRASELMRHNARMPCEIMFSVQLNHYIKMLLTVMIDRENEEGGEYLISGFIYSIELSERQHLIASEETTADIQSPLVIVNALIHKLEKYDLKHLYFCKYCDQHLVEKSKECCESCYLSKITYDEMCAICQDDDYKILPSVWAKLECEHVFHRNCILQIKHHQPKRIKCPLCRHDQTAWSAII